ncbi:MAG: hydroxyethylthiazole kinase [Gaiellales bacterium]|nr:MAG: hydroxyethylthiazole kinase [Gaiellales bacterium]
MEMRAQTTELLSRIRSQAPLVHNITNFVVMNSSANILLAVGASPVMAHSPDEVEEMTAMAGALVLNIGTLQKDWVDAMVLAARAANDAGVPVILDPVGAGATKLRTGSVRRIMDEASVSVLRGNASEVLSLGSDEVKTKGVDSSLSMSDAVVDAARQMAREEGCVIAISGEEDCVTDGEQVFRVKNGHPLMTRVTGTGCGLSAVTGAFCAVADGDLAEATAAAFGFYGLCGELAAESSGGPASFEVAFLDRLYAAGERDVDGLLRVEQA